MLRSMTLALLGATAFAWLALAQFIPSEESLEGL
jgi:hypothetical protein